MPLTQRAMRGRRSRRSVPDMAGLNPARDKANGWRDAEACAAWMRFVGCDLDMGLGWERKRVWHLRYNTDHG
jgi:hypothetical protein